MHKALIFTLAAPVLASPALKPLDLAKCVDWCRDPSNKISNPDLTCVLPAISQKGPCYVCGPLKTNRLKKLCNGKCLDTSNDNKNCGSCNKKCLGSDTCIQGLCSCGAGNFQPCGSGGDCLCVNSIVGPGVCIQNFHACPTKTCKSNSDCGGGVCVDDKYCPSPVCADLCPVIVY